MTSPNNEEVLQVAGDPSLLTEVDDGESRSSSEYKKGKVSTSIAAPTSPYRPFPPVMNGYSLREWSLEALKAFKLCGSDENDFLYIIEAHNGLSAKGPLDTRPGWYLHNGTSSKDPILAAAGDESQHASVVYGFNLNTIIRLPPLQPSTKSKAMVTEFMHATTTRNHGVAFRFSIETGSENMQREDFEWRKTPKSTDAEKGGFELVRLLSCSNEAKPNVSDSDGQGLVPPPASDSGCETVAMITWKGIWKHGFTLELKGSGLSGGLGERWSLMVVITGVRLLGLRATGRTKWAAIRIAEKIRG